jgi:hypothetical protein
MVTVNEQVFCMMRSCVRKHYASDSVGAKKDKLEITHQFGVRVIFLA